MRVSTWGRIGGERGFTLIELMVTMVVALLTVAAMMGVFSVGQRLYRTQEQVSDTQQNVRVSTDAIARDLRMANFGPCGAAVQSFGGAIQLLPITHVNGAGATPDQVTIMYADGNTEMNVTQQMPSQAAALFVDNATQVQEDDIVIVTNCTNSDVIQVTGPACLPGCGVPQFEHNAGGSLNTTNQLSTSYGPGAKVYKVNCVRYRVDMVNSRLLMEKGGSVCQTPGGTVAPAVGSSVVLAENVEGLELAYGLDTNGGDADGNGCNDGDGTIDTWINAFSAVAATQACQVSQVRSVRVNVLARTGTPQKDFSYAATTTIEDKVYATPVGTESQRRRVLATEVKPRNIGL
ncbi:MAG: hypothetical protein A2V83_08765 [Nitrospirae bacterium RBG_16_64_22]|nr:MAG: hypothetical protein A2V83_08765 [Nitrospirae bacterium RBG_16_64_22]